MTKNEVIKMLALSGHSQMGISNYLNDRFPSLTFPDEVGRILVHELGILNVPKNEEYKDAQ